MKKKMILTFHISSMFRFALLALAMLWLPVATYSQSFILNLQSNPMSFTNSQRTVITNTGNGGTNAGSVHKYSNVITKDGVTVYALLTILQKNNATITNFDDDAITGEMHRFQPRIGSGSGGGSVVYQLEFFNTADNQPVFIYNYYMTAIDIDGNSSSNREFVEVGGYTSYQVNNPTGLTISTNSTTGRTKFLGITYGLDGVTFENSAAFISRYLNPNNKITFVLGQSGSNTERFYSVQFGVAGGAFSNPVVVNNPLPVAVDDDGTPVNGATGGTAVANVLTNDLFDGVAVVPSEVDITLVNPASHPGIVLNTTSGAVTVAPGTPGGNYTLDYQICMKASPSDCGIATVFVSVLQADLAITKTVTPGSAVAGQNITYNITVVNNGPTEATQVVVEDILDLPLVSVTPSAGTWLAPYWTIGTLASGASVNLVIVATIDPGFTGILANTATVSSPIGDPVTTNNSATVNINVTAPVVDADLAVTKTVNPNPVIAGQGIVYTITVKNNGPAVAQSVSLQDVPSTNLTFVGASASPGTSWATPAWTIGTLATGSTVTLTIVATVNAGFTGTINNTAVVTSATPDPNPVNNTASVLLTVNPVVPVINLYPATGPGTLAFEDLWPSKGDYDFNDMVVDYQFEINTSPFNMVQNVKATFTLKAFGAYFHNGFGFQLPAAISATDITVTGYNLSKSYITFSGNGTEAGQSKPTIIVFDDAYSLMPHPGTGIGVNTERHAPYVTPVTIQLMITFKPDTYSNTDLDIANFNPFIIVNQDRGVEVHLPDYPPTSLANQVLFGTQDDNSNPSQSRYYKTQNNLPWAINIYESFDYPLEKVDITTAHLKFAPWATSSGQNFPDWYQDKPGYRNNGNIY
jgi:LruC domain-containing protein/uncharacterized repeat protein (TIGR01451 family)